ncbi:LLM class flavin-dependent oxidoreductase [Paenibacillus antri]|uniref:LLM class flavin-dependent oxidoreductase n=1 Tax=Paenibacillus antri TaxID=2582848 RepID=A0A5R9G1R0_9BACL|nr:LLM class flavin-dependent oxidoreductase [Paenibacillus antri]TLS50272.1 LLM class flavin-dependent oxidoreductase [Paenibacillus antri]
MKLKIGVLDQSPLLEGVDASEALRQTIRLAKRAEALGFERYWVAEHHDTPGLAGSAPEVLIAAIAANTARIRVGSGGVLLPHYSPYKVAEQFRVLEALYPGRIDLGLGRAPGGMPLASKALRYGRTKIMDDRLPDALLELYGYLHDRLPEGHELQGLQATPVVPTAPELWLLGSSVVSAEIAAKLGGAFVFAHFINGDDGAQVVRDYRDAFRPGPLGDAPRVIVAVHVVCAERDEDAEAYATALDLRFLLFEQGQFGRPFPTPEEVRDYPYSEWDRMRIVENRKRMLVGGPEAIRGKLAAFADAYGVDELLVVTYAPTYEARLRSYELLAESTIGS